MRMVKAIPALPVRNIEQAVEFYRDRLHFVIGHRDDSFAIVTRSDVEIHLWAAFDETWRNRRSNPSTHPVVSGAESFIAGTASCRVEVIGIEDLYEEYRTSQVLYDPKTVVERQPWGTREFPVLDQERNLITFYER